jgi:response regulator RpfG family c-di-GMP phosphodiesterase
MLLIRQPLRREAAGRPLVVCVGEDTSTLSAVAGALASERVDLVLTHDGDEAVELARRDRADVVICSQRLAGMSGCVLLRSIARLSPRTGRVMLADEPDPAVDYEVSLGTVECLVSPPWYESDLRQVIQPLLTRNPARSASSRPRTA